MSSAGPPLGGCSSSRSFGARSVLTSVCVGPVTSSGGASVPGRSAARRWCGTGLAGAISFLLSRLWVFFPPPARMARSPADRDPGGILLCRWVRRGLQPALVSRLSTAAVAYGSTGRA